MNTLKLAGRRQIWFPPLFFANTDKSDLVLLKEGVIKVKKEGQGTESPLSDLNEMAIYRVIDHSWRLRKCPWG